MLIMHEMEAALCQLSWIQDLFSKFGDRLVYSFLSEVMCDRSWASTARFC